MSIAISKWGNSAALRLPKDLLDRLSLQVGDKVEIQQQGNQIVITPSKPSLEELLSRVTAQNKHQSLVNDVEGRELL